MLYFGTTIEIEVHHPAEGGGEEHLFQDPGTVIVILDRIAEVGDGVDGLG